MFNCNIPRTQVTVFGFTVLVCAVVAAQQPAPQAEPEDFGLLLPQARPVAGGGRRVLVHDGTEQLVVGKVHVEVGDRLVVMLPDGRLISVKHQEATATDRPFEPASKEAVIESLTATKFKGFKTRETNRYVYIFNTSDAFAEATSRILETMYPSLYAYCKRQKLTDSEPETPLVVIMFRTEAEYQGYREMPAGVVAYYNAVSNRVVMYEQSQLADVAPAIALKQSISTIAHEGVHQILNNIGVQQRLSNWPMWIGEGLPEFFSPTSTDRRIKWKGVGLVNDLRMHELIEYLKARPEDTDPGDLVRQTVTAPSLTSTGYAAAWALTHYLAKYRQPEFFAYLSDVSALPPLVEPTNGNLDLFTRHFGEDLAGIENGMLASLKKLPYVDPIANQPHFVAVIQIGLRRSVVVTTSPASIRQWQQQVLSELSAAERASAKMSVQAFPNKSIADRTARSLMGG